ncbi:hypothetical protein [Nonomuraea sp. NPDC049784]
MALCKQVTGLGAQAAVRAIAPCAGRHATKLGAAGAAPPREA